VISRCTLSIGICASSFILVLFSGVHAPAQQPNREDQIKELQKQIDLLNKKVEQLRQPGPAPAIGGDVTVNPEWIKSLTWRSIGPAAMGGRITAISVFEADPCTYWVATASGGLLKTVNNGVTFDHQFDREATVSIGDVCVAPSNANIVWVGTGEANPRNSVSYGDGVYKSTDGGKTWKNMGLKKSFQIGRIKVHPRNPEVVYVGALGRLYGPNEERGLYKTTDGGRTWQKILYVDEKTGVIDMQMHPADPDTLLVATYERLRDGFDSQRGQPPPVDGYDGYDPIKKWGPGSALYKTTDGGKTFHKITKGLPTCHLGRIGIEYYRKDPKVVYLVLESEKLGMGTPPPAGRGQNDVYLGVAGQDADAGAKLTGITKGSPAEKAGLLAGDIVLTVDAQPILAYQQLADQLRAHKAGDKLVFKVSRNRVAKDTIVTLESRTAGPGRTTPPVARSSSTRPYSFMYSGQRENVQAQQGPDSFQYGGVYKSSDGGESWTRINSVNPRPMYFSQIRVDPTDDKYLYVLGVSLYRSTDGGKTFKPDGGKEVHPDQHALWINPKDGRHMIVGCDGGFYVTYDRMANWDYLNHCAIGQFYHVALDNRQPYHVYGGLQDNGSWGAPNRTLRTSGLINEDWIMLGGGDGFVCRVDPNDPDLVYWEFQDGNMFRRNLRTGESLGIRPRARPGTPLQINWFAPFLISWLNQPIIPFAPNLVKEDYFYRYNWNTPFILSSHNSHIFYCAGNHVFRSVKQGQELRPISPEISRTKRGTATALAESPRNPDVLYVGTDDGALWVTRDGGTQWTNIADKIGLSGPRWVSSIEPSRHVDGRAYVVFDAHRSDDDDPYVYVTEDFGETWKSLRANLPWGSTRVLREDIQNPSIIYLGTEFGVWTSTNRGASWVKLNNNLPTVAVHELAQHPTTGDMVAATHGRSLWVLNVAPLRQMSADILKAKAYLYQPNAVVRWRSEPDRSSMYGTGVRHFIGQNPERGGEIWYHLLKKADKISLKIIDVNGKEVRDLSPKNEPGLHKVLWNLTRFAAGVVPAGVYRVVLNVDGQEFSQTLRVDADPAVPTAVVGPEMPGEEDKEPERLGSNGEFLR
jgi:photosystem II stability/assembly factor-like uncharacterized protein